MSTQTDKCADKREKAVSTLTKLTKGTTLAAMWCCALNLMLTSTCWHAEEKWGDHQSHKDEIF